MNEKIGYLFEHISFVQAVPGHITDGNFEKTNEVVTLISLYLLIIF